jgi:acyl-CoA synthetase (AMP-forming)/AMP-acid ligase II
MINGRSIRWNAKRAADAYARGLWVYDTLAGSLQRAARDTPHRIVIIDGDHRISCADLQTRAAALAQALLERAPSGSVVSFMLPNWHEAAVIYLAATLAGMIVNPILPSLRDRELLFILQDVQCRLIFVPSSLRQLNYAAMLGRVVAQMESPPDVVVLRGDAGGHTTFSSLSEREICAFDFPALNPDAVRLILYTSGTTGRPKGVLHSHNSIHALMCQLREHWLIEPGDKFLVPSPIAHIGGSIYAFECPLLLGTTAVLMDRWNADDAIQLLTMENCTHMAGATPFLTQILAAAHQTKRTCPA